jgi:small subunit ribosomal protein S1
MSWTKKNVHPGKIVSTSQEVEVMILEVDPDKRRISSASSRPWATRGRPSSRRTRSARRSRARSATSPSSACSSASATSTAWCTSPTSTGNEPGEEAVKRYNKGDVVKAKVLDVDVEKERISLGIKQLETDPFKEATSGIKKGDRRHLHGQGGDHRQRHRGRVDDGCTGFIRKAELSRDRDEQRPSASPWARRSTPRSPTSTSASRR